ncbi:glycosyltransferase [Rhodonellum sp.]|uniref:glycosyltransferase n=1 Tax=Rhodonellum sp. TaxID=2231180 RepID=UPI0027207563|nr:glycosyltransferase [Rhodonellum sp.]MDO9553110.1 glycosyltransferase [Rhodonellum sp.]
MASLGGFVITYNRSEILLETIQAIFDQSVPPQKLWIIDNSEDDLTEKSVYALHDSRLSYYHMGFNSGPAGAAAKGLELCGKEGFDWIYWGDDNDPPPLKDTFERQFNALINLNHELIGQIGIVGQRFNSKLGKIDRIPAVELQNSDWIEVDTISGGQSKIVSRKVVVLGVRPNPSLFYGFEELDFDLKLKANGFKSIVGSCLFLEMRIKYNRMDFKRPLYSQKSEQGLMRQYYSTRNLIYILKENRFVMALIFQIIKNIFKSMIGFRFGWHYGSQNSKNIINGMLDGLFGDLSNKDYIISGR